MFWEQNLRIYRRLLYDNDVFCNVGAYAQRKELLMNLRLLDVSLPIIPNTPSVWLSFVLENILQLLVY